MIPVQTVVNRMAAALDAENSDRYIFARDYAHAINYGIEFVVNCYNSIFSSKKAPAEGLRELNRTVIYRTSQYSRVRFDPTELGYSVWTVAAVYPKPELIGTTTIPVATPNQSVLMSNTSFRKSYFDAKRITQEEVANNRLNPFAAGNEITTCEALKEYAWLDFSDYTGGYTMTGNKCEIEIIPEIDLEAVAVSIIKYPTLITAITDNIQLPENLTSFVVDKSLNFISFKQGDATTLYGVTERDINKLLKLS